MADLLAPFAGKHAADVAQRLIGRFGTLERIFQAPLPHLCAVAGGHEQACAALLQARCLPDIALRENLAASEVNGGDVRLHRWLCAHIGGLADERVHVVFCDSHRRFIADETSGAGGVRSIVFRIRPLIERALSLGAGGILLAHNHPSGVCLPSDADLTSTRRVADIAAAIEIDLVDHLIVTRRAVFSMRQGGCL